MQKSHKDLLRALVAGLRHTLLGRYDDAGGFQPGDLDRELERLGVGRDGRITPLDALPYATFHERRAHRVAEAKLVDVPGAQRPAVRQEIVERAAYTWINRLLALRAMEARGLLDETLRPNPAYDGITEALFILRHTAPERTAGADGGWWAVIEDACRAQAAGLPGLFDLDDPNAALRPSTMALIKCVGLVGGGVDKEIGNHPGGTRRQGAEGNGLDGVFRDPDAIGWAYQFYQEEAKARVYAKLGRGGKVETRGEIAAVTQLFTEPYMVQWLLQNSLGRSYHELYPDSRLPETWAYYIRRPEDQVTGHGSPFTSLADLTFMDPCMGGGHLEREAFDMLATMYREQQPEMDATAIADRILSHHLHGIDIDPRAAQLAGLTLYLRAWELVRDERRQRGLAGPGEYRPPRLNLATTPTHLTPGALQRHLQRHPEDRPFEPLLHSVFEALEQAPILGSLLKPGEHLDQALAAYRKPHAGVQMGLLDESASLNRLLEELARHDPDELKRVLLERISRSFAAEAEDADDVGAALFGREASEGMRLLQLLDRKYAVVATNPPYMGNNSFCLSVKQYVEQHYLPGKRDLYAAFIMRCQRMCVRGGRVAMITQQSWAFLKSFSELRAIETEARHLAPSNTVWRGLLKDTTLDVLAHLGEHAFHDPAAAGAFVLMFVTAKRSAEDTHRIVALRAVGPTDPLGKAEILRETAGSQSSHPMLFSPTQSGFLGVPKAPLCYWLPDTLMRATQFLRGQGADFRVSEGLGTRDELRFIRLIWEQKDFRRWHSYSKGGGYCRWFGHDQWIVEWAENGARVKSQITERYPPEKFTLLIRHEYLFGTARLLYSRAARGSLGVRVVNDGPIPGDTGPALLTSENDARAIAGFLNCRVNSYLLRALTAGGINFMGFYIGLVPIHLLKDERQLVLDHLAEAAIALKTLVVQEDPAERSFTPVFVHGSVANREPAFALLYAVEAAVERVGFTVYQLTKHEISTVLEETGTPVGWFSLIVGYDVLPVLPSDIDLSQLPQEVLDCLATHERVHPDPAELARIKANLRTLYEAGPGAKTEDADLEELEHQGDEDEAVSGAYIPIPTETFLEELSVKLHIHPISVYWLLEELRAEGVRCKPEERRLLEDRLSVLTLRLLGHRWPRQLEAGEPAPPWADRDGIIPLSPGAGEATVAERLRQRLRAEDGPLGAQRVEALLEELTGQTLEVWLRKTFFERHTRQFKRRPIAWQLASTPMAGAKGKVGKKGKHEPAFECLLYYHACGGDVLARIRTQYVEPLLIAERRRVDQARKAGDDSAAALATARIHELEDFAGRLRQVEESGFTCAALDDFVAGEPLDRWSGDGVFPPADRETLLAQERAWRVDINDGVRVNVAPLQAAGLLVGDVLNKKDLPKAIADRARWRSDERRWVRAGKLPRCGWMDESIPESPAWTELAPEREAEQVRLEEKRKAALGQTGASMDSR